MSAPVIWIILPFVLSVIFLFLGRKKPGLVNGLAIGFGIFLGLFAFIQTIDGLLALGPVSIQIKSSLPFFGRAFVLQNENRFLLGVIYLAYAVFVFVSQSAGVDQKFTALSLSIAAILIAAVAVEPFLYSAILIELAILIVIPLANKRESSDDKSLLNFLIYLSLAMPFILLAGWILGGIQANPTDAVSLNKAAILLGIGFALWLGVFPFHSWIPKFAGSAHPLVSGFLFSVLPTTMLFIIVDFIFGLTWLRESTALFSVVRVIGSLMVVTGGILLAVEKDVKRILGLMVQFETGAALLLLSFSDAHHQSLFYLSFLPRIAGLGLLSYALSIFQSNKQSLTINDLKGSLRQFPFTSGGLILSLLSLLGFPLLGSFPIKMEIILSFAGDMQGQLWFLAGCSGLIIGIYRIIVNISIPGEKPMTVLETKTQVAILVMGTIFLLIIGVFPESVVKILGGLITQISTMN